MMINLTGPGRHPYKIDSSLIDAVWAPSPNETQDPSINSIISYKGTTIGVHEAPQSIIARMKNG